MKNILLINPDPVPRVSPPLGLCYIAETLQINKHKVTILDLGFNKDINIENIDYIGIVATTLIYAKAKEVILKIRKLNKNIPIIIGGPHASLMPDFVLRDSGANAVVVGEGENIMLDIINGKIIPEGIINAPIIENLDSIPFPKYEGYININQYFKFKGTDKTRWGIGQRVLGTIGKRGCPFRCTYCASNALYKRRVRSRSVENIMKEIDYSIEKYNIQGVSFYDDTITLDKNWMKELCNGLAKRNLKWICNSRIDTVDEKILNIMKKSGCLFIAFGVECLAPDTNIQLSDGSFVEIQNHNDKENILSVDFDSLRLKSADNIKLKKVNEKKQMLEIKSVFPPRKITVTPTHKFFTYGEKGIEEIEAQNLKKGDYVAIIKEFNIGKPKYGIKLSEILGYFTGDGYADFHIWKSKKTSINYPRYRVRFFDKNKKLLDYYQSQISKIFNCKPRIDKRKGNAYVLSLTHKKFLEFLKSLGLMVKSPLKQIPREILQSTNNEAMAYLRGLFDADGCICKEGSIRLDSSSKKLIEQSKLLLSRLGIESYIREIKYEKFGKKWINYRLTCKHLKDFNKIGFNHPEKQKRLKSLLKKLPKTKQNYSKSIALPIPPSVIKKMFRESNSSNELYFYRDTGMSLSPYFYGGNTPSKMMIKRLVSSLKNKSPIVNSILKFANSKNICWSKIRSIEKKKCNVVYDLYVPKYSNYIANGFIVHNSGSNRVLKDIMKKGITIEQAEKTLRLAKKIGIGIVANYMFGLPGETEEDLKLTLDAIKRLPADIAEFSIFIPLPGTVLAANLDWTQYDCYKNPYHVKSPVHSEEFNNIISKYHHKAIISFYFAPMYLIKSLRLIFHPKRLYYSLKSFYALLKDSFKKEKKGD